MAYSGDQQRRRSIIDLTWEEARAFLLKEEEYCDLTLPRYFQFSDLLKDVSTVLEGKRRSDLMCRKKARNLDRVNHVLLSNKDGRYAWRPLELAHPALYVSLVNEITTPDHWTLICGRFREFAENDRIKCLSLPVESMTKEKNKAELINQWWQDVEQRSIELSLEYDFMIQTDINDCYPTIYTHTIAWALHSKQDAKDNRNKRTASELIGDIIDSYIQDMRYGQTNGIPQGSVLMDFIAEMVLGYADTELTFKISNEIDPELDYRILRYRDDYRIFVTQQQHGEKILKCLAEVLTELGLKLNPRKTDISQEVIQSSIKDDKLDWIFRKQTNRNPQKRLLIIHDHSMEHPDSGSLCDALDKYRKRLRRKTPEDDQILSLISIVVDIAYKNPRTYPISSAILSELIDLLETDEEKRDIVEKTRRKFHKLPKTGYMDIWLQRISHKFAPDIEFKEPLCRLVGKKATQIWDNSWISSRDLKEAIEARKIVHWKTLEDMPPIVTDEEVELFSSSYNP